MIEPTLGTNVTFGPSTVASQARVLGGSPESVDILFFDIARQDWATGGVLWSNKSPAKPAG